MLAQGTIPMQMPRARGDAAKGATHGRHDAAAGAGQQVDPEPREELPERSGEAVELVRAGSHHTDRDPGWG